jgi:type I restriction enzyme S subunit
MSAHYLMPSDWATRRIGECCVVKRGASPRPIQDPKWWGGSVGWVRISDVTASSKYLYRTRDYLSAQGVRHSVLMPAGSVVLSICATIGLPIILTEPVCIHDGFVWFEGLDENIDREFLYYFLEKERSVLVSQKQIGTQGNLNTSIVSGVELLLPPLPEQSKIAEVLSTVDRGIEQTEALIAKQQRIKTGLMADLLTRGIDEHGNLRSEATHTFKDSPLGRIPVEWEVKRFDDAVEHSAFGPRFPSTAYSESGNLAMLRTTDLDGIGNIDYAAMPIATLDLKAFKNHFLSEGDLLISRSGTIGIPAVFKSYHLPVIPGAFLIRFRLDSSKADSSYWRAYFNWEVGKHRLVSLGEGGVVKNIRASSVNQMMVAFPSIEEQRAVTSKLRLYDAGDEQYYEVLSKLRALKTALMQDLLTGEVRVTPLLNQEVVG